MIGERRAFNEEILLQAKRQKIRISSRDNPPEEGKMVPHTSIF